MIEVRMMLDKKRKGKKNAKERRFISFAPFPPRKPALLRSWSRTGTVAKNCF
jgi:hypothetical protein